MSNRERVAFIFTWAVLILTGIAVKQHQGWGHRSDASFILGMASGMGLCYGILFLLRLEKP